MCNGKTLAPAIVDLGVFAIDLAAFHAGGIVRVGLMPDQSPVLDDPGIVQRAALIGKPDLWIHPLAAATRGLAGTDLAEMAINRDAGARAVATGRRWIADSGMMAKVLAYARDLDLAVVTHAEDSGLTANAVATAGETATPARPCGRAGARRTAGDRARPDAGGGKRRQAAHPPGDGCRELRV